jgi:hypothetical protein
MSLPADHLSAKRQTDRPDDSTLPAPAEQVPTNFGGGSGALANTVRSR